MRDPRLEKLGEVLVRHCVGVCEGDLVTIVSEPGAMDAVEAVFLSVLRAGGHPSFHPKSERLRETLLRHGSDKQLTHVSPFEMHRLAACDVLIVLTYPSNTRYLSRIEPRRLALSESARREPMMLSLGRHARGETRYCLAEVPSHATAQDAEMSLAEYEDFVWRAGFLDLPDPIGAWRRLDEQHRKAIEFLRTTSTLLFRSPACNGAGGSRVHDGTKLTVDVSGMTWASHAARENFPDGEIETGPRSINGVVNFTHPCQYRGIEVDGVRLEFKDGRVVNASAERNEDRLFALLDQDAGARNAGEIAIGTNYRIGDFTRNTFYDEKIGGTFHVALGAGYPQTGNTNQSALHWDMVCDLRSGGSIHADGELIQRDGRFVRDGWPGL